MTTESELFQRIRSRTTKDGFIWERLENAIKSGTFDTIVEHICGMAWVELKIQNNVNPVEDLRSSQQVWVRLRLLRGLKKYAIIRLNKQSDIEVHLLRLIDNKLTSTIVIPTMLTSKDYLKLSLLGILAL